MEHVCINYSVCHLFIPSVFCLFEIILHVYVSGYFLNKIFKLSTRRPGISKLACKWPLVMRDKNCNLYMFTLFYFRTGFSLQDICVI